MIKISPAKSFVLSFLLYLIAIYIVFLSTLAFSRDAQHGLPFRLVIHNRELAQAHWECPKGIRGWAQEQQCVQMLSKLISSQLEPELHIGAGEVVVAVVWASSGEILKDQTAKRFKGGPSQEGS